MTAPFRVAMRKDLGRAAWDALADASDEAWLWHCYDLQDALETWRGSADESFALLSPDEDEPLALVPLRRVMRKVLGTMPLFVLDSLGGPALRNGLGDRRRRALLAAAREHLASLARAGLCLEVRLALPPMAPALRGSACPRVNPLLAMACENTLTQTWVVDLREGRESVWNRMDGRARTAMRKAEKTGVTVRQAGPDDCSVYYRLHCDTYQRTGAQPHSAKYFDAIWERFLARGLVRIWIAELDGEPVAAENFGVYKRAAIYWTGAASAKGLAAEANSLLQWTAMQWMMTNGIEWYETGEAFPHASAGKQKGLNDFKKSFGGELYPYYRGRLSAGGAWGRLYRCLQENRR